jgi:Tol biopolymer transport system component
VLARTDGPFDFSPSDLHLVYGRDSPPCGMYIVRTDGVGEARRLTGVPCITESVAWSPNGSWIAYVTRNNYGDEDPIEEIWLTRVAAGDQIASTAPTRATSMTLSTVW